MSVINQMLKDLDSRQQQNNSADGQDYPQIPAHAAEQKPSKRAVIWSLLIVVIILYAIWMFWPHIQQQFTQAPQESAIQPTIPDEQTTSTSSQSNSVEQVIEPVETVQAAKPTQTISATLAKPVAEKPTTALTQAKTAAAPTAESQVNTEVLANKPAQLQAKTQPTKAELPATKVEKQASSLQIQNTQKSPEEIAYGKYERAQDLLNKGQFITAEQQLISALQLKNDLHQARVLLVSMFYGGQNTAKALATLKQGIQAYPDYWDYRFIAARILNEQNQAQAAWQVLASVPNTGDIAGYHTNMFQFKANLAQQLQYWQEAYQVWQTLLTLNPSHAKWHLGAAISAEQQGEKQLALQHYQTVANQGGVSSASGKFVEQKIAELQP